MSDTYQAVYDAVRSRIGNFDGSQLVDAISRQFDISLAVEIVKDNFRYTADMQTRPSVLYKPALYPDGNQWCALYGEDLQSGVAGFGDTPEKAMTDFDNEWIKIIEVPPKSKAEESGVLGASAGELTSKLTIKEKVFCAYDGCEAVNGVGHSMYCEAAHEEHYIIMNQKP